MEKSVKSGGRTVEEAIQTGLANLQVERDRVEVELLGDSADSEYPVMVQLTVRTARNKFWKRSCAAWAFAVR